MKKTYITPTTRAVGLYAEMPVCAGSKELQIGGDTDETIDGEDARSNKSVWGGSLWDGMDE